MHGNNIFPEQKARGKTWYTKRSWLQPIIYNSIQNWIRVIINMFKLLLILVFSVHFKKNIFFLNHQLKNTGVATVSYSKW